MQLQTPKCVLATTVESCSIQNLLVVAELVCAHLQMKKLVVCDLIPSVHKGRQRNTELFISPSGISELDCATTKTDTAERSISLGRESLPSFFFVLGALAYFQVPPLGGSREEKWRSQ